MSKSLFLSLSNGKKKQNAENGEEKTGIFVAEAAAADVTMQESVEAAVKRAVDLFGRVDYCVICAGVSLFLFVLSFRSFFKKRKRDRVQN